MQLGAGKPYSEIFQPITMTKRLSHLLTVKHVISAFEQLFY